MSTLVVFGGTGNVGRGVLAAAASDARVTRVLALQRKPVDPPLPKVTHVAVTDFGDLAAHEDAFRDVSGVVFALGVSQSAVGSEAEYRRITIEFPLEAARRLADASPGAAFVYVSGAGADPSGRSRFLFGRVKGEAETKLAAMPGLRVVNARPGGIVPPPGVKQRMLGERLFDPLIRLIEPWAKGTAIKSVDLGRALVACVYDTSRAGLVDNAALRAIAALKA